MLRQQLIVLNRQIKQPQLTSPDCFCLVLLSHLTSALSGSSFSHAFLAGIVNAGDV